jgi:hypothetical protein
MGDCVRALSNSVAGAMNAVGIAVVAFAVLLTAGALVGLVLSYRSIRERD